MSAGDPQAGAGPERAPASSRGWAWRLAVVAALVALDLWSKSAVFAWLGEYPAGMEADRHGHPRMPLVGEWFAFFLSYNPGMAWGVTALPPWLLVGGRVAASLFLLVLVLRGSGGPGLAARAMGWALVLILAGALGNLHDNLFLEPRREGARFGEVRDFIDVYFTAWDWHFPTFNVADACISVGAVLLFAVSFLGPRPEAEPEPDEGGAGA